MKTKTINTLILATALSVAGVSYAVAETNTDNTTYAQDCTKMQKDGYGGKHHSQKQRANKRGGIMGFEKLNLTTEQKQEMKTIMTSHQEATEELRNAHKAEMQTLMQNDSFDETKAKALIAEKELTKENRALAMLQLKHQMYQVLTAEQQAEYETKPMRHHHKR